MESFLTKFQGLHHRGFLRRFIKVSQKNCSAEKMQTDSLKNVKLFLIFQKKFRPLIFNNSTSCMLSDLNEKQLSIIANKCFLSTVKPHCNKHHCNYRSSSRPEVFCKKGFLRNFAKFTGKHLPVPESLF